MSFSLLERLTQSHDVSNGTLHPDSLEYIRSMRESLCQDLTALLNTRRAEQEFDPGFDEAANSVLTFGIADFTSLNLTSGSDRERVRRSIEWAIRRFEPRLAHVSVTLDESNDTH